MKIGEKIRKYRKEQNMTQEDIANFLGITAPAVNKWENGISYPDITLLAPLARILKTDVDTLVSFREEMTDMEISRLTEEITKEIMEVDYEVTFEKVRELIKAYPNCNKLIFSLAQMMNFYLPVKDPEKKEDYEKQIDAWFELIALCEEKELANMATVMLCQKAIAEGAFERAQSLLDKIPSQGMDKRMIEANICVAQKDYEKAYAIYEAMVYQKACLLIGSLTQLCQLKCREKLFEDALFLADLSRTVAERFDMGSYISGNAEFAVAVEMKDKERTLKVLKEMFSGIDVYPMKSSRLYQHLNLKDNDNFGGLRTMFKPVFDKDESLDFIREEPEFKAIMEML